MERAFSVINFLCVIFRILPFYPNDWLESGKAQPFDNNNPIYKYLSKAKSEFSQGETSVGNKRKHGHDLLSMQNCGEKQKISFSKLCCILYISFQFCNTKSGVSLHLHYIFPSLFQFREPYLLIEIWLLYNWCGWGNNFPVTNNLVCCIAKNEILKDKHCNKDYLTLYCYHKKDKKISENVNISS